MVKVQTSDGETFTVQLEVAQMSVTICNMLELLDDSREQVLPLALDATMYRKALTWCVYHFDDKEKVYPDWRDVEVSSWDIEFFGQDEDMVCRLMEAAEYLKIDGLRKTLGKCIVGTWLHLTPMAEVMEKLEMSAPDDGGGENTGRGKGSVILLYFV